MERNDRIARADQDRAARERAARGVLDRLGAAELERRPWRPRPVPLSSVDLLEFFTARAAGDRAGALAALELLQSAREELDALEAGVLFAARGAGLTWREMAQAMGLNSPQACQQRLDRLVARQDGS